MKVDIQQFRADLFGMLDDIAGGGEDFPFDFGELRCMWFDDHWYRSHEFVQDGVLSEAEYLILARFSETFRAAYPRFTPITEPDMRKLKGDPVWESVVLAARRAKAELIR